SFRQGNRRSSSTKTAEMPRSQCRYVISPPCGRAGYRTGRGREPSARREGREGGPAEDRGHDDEAAGGKERETGEALTHGAPRGDGGTDSEAEASGEALQQGGRGRCLEREWSAPSSSQPAAERHPDHQQAVPRRERTTRYRGEEARRSRD